MDPPERRTWLPVEALSPCNQCPKWYWLSEWATLLTLAEERPQANLGWQQNTPL